MPDTTVEHRDHRYEIRVGDDVAGEAQYVDRGNQRIFFHTEIDPAFQGQGLSKPLIRDALDDTRQAGMRIVPVCRAVARYVRKHSSFDDITDRVTPELLKQLRAALDQAPDGH